MCLKIYSMFAPINQFLLLDISDGFSRSTLFR